MSESDSRMARLEEQVQALDRLTDQRFDGFRLAIRAEFTALGRAVDKAEAANEKRFESVNEFRGQLADQAATFMPRVESEKETDFLASRIGVVEKKVEANSTGRATLSSAFGYGIGAIGVITGIVALVATR